MGPWVSELAAQARGSAFESLATVYKAGCGTCNPRTGKAESAGLVWGCLAELKILRETLSQGNKAGHDKEGHSWMPLFGL